MWTSHKQEESPLSSEGCVEGLTGFLLSTRWDAASPNPVSCCPLQPGFILGLPNGDILTLSFLRGKSGEEMQILGTLSGTLPVEQRVKGEIKKEIWKCFEMSDDENREDLGEASCAWRPQLFVLFLSLPP